MADQIRLLEVCAGIGGFSLGLRLALGDRVRPVGFIERESYAASLLMARMEDESLECAPVFCGEIHNVDGSELKGQVDLLASGFPCQPWSTAGKRRGKKDERAIWPDIAKLIADVEPSAVLLENVQLSAFQDPYEDLRRMGFIVSDPVKIGAVHVGAPHRRYRYFALAYRNVGNDCGIQQARKLQERGGGGSCRERTPAPSSRSPGAELADTDNERSPRPGGHAEPEGVSEFLGIGGEELADSESESSEQSSYDESPIVGKDARKDPRGGGLRSGEELADSEKHHRGTGVGEEETGTGQDEKRRRGSPSGGEELADPESLRGDQSSDGQRSTAPRADSPGGEALAFPPGPQGDWAGVPPELWPAVGNGDGRRRRQQDHAQQQDQRTDRSGPKTRGQAATQPAVRGMAHGIPDRMDRLRCLGNAVMPSVVAAAWRELTKRENL